MTAPTSSDANRAANDGPHPDTIAVVVARGGRLPLGARETAAEAGGMAVVAGSGARHGAEALLGARRVWWTETGEGFLPGQLVARLAGWLEPVDLVVLPASPDGRDLAPRLAAALHRPLLAGAISTSFERHDSGCSVETMLARLDDRVLLPARVDGPAVVTLVPGSRGPVVGGSPDVLAPLPEPLGAGDRPRETPVDPEVIAVIPPDLRTMDLADAHRVVTGGAGLAAGGDDQGARQTFSLLVEVAAALGASAGATRVATDAGWTAHQRQIGITGVTVDPDLYLALGVSGAAQHIGGLGDPRHIVSVNSDPSCPMTAMADLGLVTDARALLEELAARLGVQVDQREGPARRDRPNGDRPKEVAGRG